jgi:hypothetical protein
VEVFEPASTRGAIGLLSAFYDGSYNRKEHINAGFGKNLEVVIVKEADGSYGNHCAFEG